MQAAAGIAGGCPLPPSCTSGTWLVLRASHAEQQHSEVSACIPSTAQGESNVPLKAYREVPSGWV